MADNYDWLRRLKAAADARRIPPPIPMKIETGLTAFGPVKPPVKPYGSSRLAITSGDQGTVLEQDMRDAEHR